MESSLTYCNPQTNEKFKVYYNSRRISKTVSQKPDNILSMHKEGSIVVNDESIMSIADETVIKVSKYDLIKKPIKSLKELLRK